MKKRFVFAALGLAVALIAFGQSSAKADHCRSGYGGGYSGYGSYYGGYGVTPVYRTPSYGYGSYGQSYRSYGSYYGGHRHHNHAAPYWNSGYGRGYGRGIQVITPSFSFGFRR